MELNLKDKNNAEYAVDKFFGCWKAKDHKKALKYIQKTWLASGDNKRVESLFKTINLADYYLYDKEIVTDCRHEVNFRAMVLEGKKEINMYGKANVIREEKPFNPSANGKWGVNPVSIIYRWVKQK